MHLRQTFRALAKAPGFTAVTVLTLAIANVAKPLVGQDVAPCVECHSEHGAVERTFVQFYPHLLDVARAKGTL